MVTLRQKANLVYVVFDCTLLLIDTQTQTDNQMQTNEIPCQVCQVRIKKKTGNEVDLKPKQVTSLLCSPEMVLSREAGAWNDWW